MRPQLWPTPSPSTHRPPHEWRRRLALAQARHNLHAAGAALGRLIAQTLAERKPEPETTSPGAVAWFRATAVRPGYWNRHARKRVARALIRGSRTANR